jgi:hypothetical protein
VKETLRELVKILREILPDKFFGEISIKFENGRIVNLKKTESVKVR